MQIATDAKILTKPVSNGFRNDLTDKALKDLGGDTKGAGFTKGTVQVTEGGN